MKARIRKKTLKRIFARQKALNVCLVHSDKIQRDVIHGLVIDKTYALNTLHRETKRAGRY